MAYEFKATRQVQFSETDMAGLMHFSNFFRFMETAEHGFYRSLGFSVVDKARHPRLGWPRVHAACDYKKPLHFEDMVEIHLLVAELRTKAVRYVFVFRKLNETPVVEVARGEMVIVCVQHFPDGRIASAPIPPEIAEKIEVAPRELISPNEQ